MTAEETRLIQVREYNKYTRLHETGYGSTGYQKQFSEFVMRSSREPDKLLEVGCGNGMVVKTLDMAGRKVQGADITLAGVKGDTGLFTEAPLWDLPFADNEFDYTFSSDTLEHLPPRLVGQSISEMFRVTSKKMFHIISTVESVYEPGLHLIIQPISWWFTTIQKHSGGKPMVVVLANPPDFIAFTKLRDGELILGREK